jgi:hypothetical protein
MKGTHNPRYVKKTTVRLTQEDLDFISGFAREHKVSDSTAIRMMLYLSRCNLQELQDKANIFLIR